MSRVMCCFVLQIDLDPVRLRNKSLLVPRKFVDILQEKAQEAWLDAVDLRIRLVLSWYKQCQDPPKFDKISSKLSFAESQQLKDVIAKFPATAASPEKPLIQPKVEPQSTAQSSTRSGKVATTKVPSTPPKNAQLVASSPKKWGKVLVHHLQHPSHLLFMEDHLCQSKKPISTSLFCVEATVSCGLSKKSSM